MLKVSRKGVYIERELRYCVSISKTEERREDKTMADKTVFVVKSTSSGKRYEIREGKDGVLYCSCPAWRFQHKPTDQRTCKHFKMAITELEKQVMP